MTIKSYWHIGSGPFRDSNPRRSFFRMNGKLDALSRRGGAGGGGGVSTGDFFVSKIAALRMMPSQVVSFTKGLDQ